MQEHSMFLNMSFEDEEGIYEIINYGEPAMKH